MSEIKSGPYRIQTLNGSEEDWTTGDLANLPLKQGELAINTTTGEMRYGEEGKLWKQLVNVGGRPDVPQIRLINWAHSETETSYDSTKQRVRPVSISGYMKVRIFGVLRPNDKIQLCTVQLKITSGNRIYKPRKIWSYTVTQADIDNMRKSGVNILSLYVKCSVRKIIRRNYNHGTHFASTPSPVYLRVRRGDAVCGAKFSDMVALQPHLSKKETSQGGIDTSSYCFKLK